MAYKYNPAEYYIIRQDIRKMYKDDKFSNDICSEIYKLRDKNKHIETLSIDLLNYNIYIEFDDKVNIKDISKVGNKIYEIINNSIMNNTDIIDSKIDKNIILEYSKNVHLIDISPMGNSLSISL